jgi:putative Holliday junction resolvase
MTDLPRAGRLLGLDWGEKRIGLALSDPSQTLAQPLVTLVRRAGRRFPMRAFRQQLETHHPVGVVVGLPIESSGEEGGPARAARELGAQISRVTGLPVAFSDERMTTSGARRAIAELGGRTRGREQDVDRLAATLLLQGFMDRRRS